MIRDEIALALLRLCFDERPSPSSLAALGGDPARWLLYRSMVRARITETVSASLPRSRAALGDAAFEGAIDRWLRDDPPTTRYARELCLAFSRFIIADRSRLPPDAPPWSMALLRYESAVMEVVIAEDPPTTRAPLAMSLPVALTPAHRVLRHDWAVHREGLPVAEDVTVLVYRDEDRALGALELNPVAREIVEHLGAPSVSLEAAITQTLAPRGLAPDSGFIESVATLLSDLLERGVVLGASTTQTVSHAG